MKKRFFLLLFILSLSFTSFAQGHTVHLNSIKNQLEVLRIETPGLDQTLNISITETSLSNFLLAIAKVHELNINVSPDLSNIQIVNNFSNVRVTDVIIFLVKEYKLDIEFTGNILSIGTYKTPVTNLDELPINVGYDIANKTISFDLKNNKLERVFREITDQTGKNLLFSPEIGNHPITLYLKDVPLEIGLQKMAVSNDLLMNISQDGFYTFESAYTQVVVKGDSPSRPVRRRQANFYYKVLDTLNREVQVDLQNTPIADVIYTLGEDLNLDIFTATPLENSGFATVKASQITFDLLLDKIFQSGVASQNPNGSGEGSQKLTYKKEKNIYYFGTEDQLSLKQVELVSLKYRSVILLDNPSGNGQRSVGRTFNNNNFNPNQNFIGQNGGLNNTNRFGNTTSGTNTSNGSQKEKSIDEIIPDDIKEGLDIKVDKELNSFVISGSGVQVERFKDFMQAIDKPVPVILIEVMILEVNRSALTETGISFGIGDQPRQTTGEFFPTGNVSIGSNDVNKIIGNFNGFGALNIGKVVPNFYLDIKAMEASGTLKIKSQPKLTTINGHKAYLSSAETTYYAVTSQNIIGSQNPLTSEIRNYFPIDAELSLTIQPFVSDDSQITLDVQVIQSAFNGERIEEDAPPGIVSREFSSIVRMEDQDVVILGGIESIRKDDSGSGVPFLARIPVIKWFFSKRRREATKRELNVVIKPTIIE